jgi:hypothetical protein
VKTEIFTPDKFANYLSVNHFPTSLHQLRLLKEARLAEQQTRVFCREAGLEVGDAGASQVGHDVFLGHVQRGKHSVRFQLDLITVQVSGGTKTHTGVHPWKNPNISLSLTRNTQIENHNFIQLS